jgi:hypothetical protein
MPSKWSDKTSRKIVRGQQGKGNKQNHGKSGANTTWKFDSHCMCFWRASVDVCELADFSRFCLSIAWSAGLPGARNAHEVGWFHVSDACEFALCVRSRVCCCPTSVFVNVRDFHSVGCPLLSGECKLPLALKWSCDISSTVCNFN